MKPPVAIVKSALMTREEATMCLMRIKSSAGVAHDEMLKLRDREGWRALGYRSWSACVEAELPICRQRTYQILKWMEINAELSTSLDNFKPLPESTTRPLSGIPTRERRAEVARKVITAAGDRQPTPREMQAAVNEAQTAPAVAPGVTATQLKSQEKALEEAAACIDDEDDEEAADCRRERGVERLRQALAIYKALGDEGVTVVPHVKAGLDEAKKLLEE